MRRVLRTAVLLLAPALVAGASGILAPARAVERAEGPVEQAAVPHDHGSHDHGQHPGDHAEGHEGDEGLSLRPAATETVTGGGACRPGDAVRPYELVAIEVAITLNRYGDMDPEGRVYALASDVDRIRAEERRKADGPTPGLQGDAIQPPVLRVVPGECLRVRLTNDLDEPASFHVHGSSLVVRDGPAATAAEPSAMAGPGSTVEYEWRVAGDEPEGSHVFHSHGDPRRQSAHGLFGTVVVEPRAATWHDPRTGEEGTTGWDAVVSAPGAASFREFVLAYHEIGDEGFLIRRHDGRDVPVVDPITSAYRPGSRAINFRSEPFMNRLELQRQRLGRADESAAYSSYAFGDPATPILRAYVGERVKERVVHGGGEVFHVHHVHGGSVRWRRQPGAGANPASADGTTSITPGPSERIDSQGLGPAESFDVEHECGAGGCQGGPGDYLVHCHVAHHYFAGMWTVWRVYNTAQDGRASTDTMPPLPTLPGDDGRAVPAVDSSALTPERRAAATRYLPARGTPRGGDASVWDWTEENGRIVGEPETSATWPGYTPVAPGRRPPVLFDPRTGVPAYPMLRPHLGARPPFAPDHGPAPALDPSTPDGEPPPPGSNGLGSLCPAGARVKQVWLRAVELPVPVNDRHGLVDPGGTLFVLAEDEDRVRADPSARTPLAIRANAGEDCVDVLLTNEIPDNGNHPFSKVSAHIHFVRFDVQAGDGVATGFNYEQTVRPFAAEGMPLTAGVAPGATRLVVADPGRFPVGASVGIGMDDTARFEVRRVAAVAPGAVVPGAVVLDRPVANGHDAGDVVSTEFVRYRWYADAQVGTSYFHDHVNGVYTWQHGLVGALVVEPPGSTYHDPVTGAEIRSGPIADVRVPAGTPVSADVTGSFRELVSFLQDGNRLTNVNRSPGSALNLRAEPLDRRSGPRHRVFSSALHGDPVTPLLRAYVGDPVVVRATVGGVNEVHTLHVDGHWFRREPWSLRSLPTSTARLGISERTDLFLPAAGGPRRRPGDYLYANGRALKLREGAWGILRVRPGPVAADLAALPGRESPSPGAPEVCPHGAPERPYAVAAVEADVPMLSPRRGRVFVPAENAAAVAAGTPATPLVLRAAVGDCLKITLTNELGDDDAPPVSLHADGLAYDPADSGGIEVGENPSQVVEPGDRRTFTFYADPEYGEGVAMLRDGADLSRSGALGLYGAVIVGPAGTTYDDPTGWETVARDADGRSWRDAVLFLHDEDDAIGTHRMPYTVKVRGAVGINYGAGEDAPRLDAYAGDPLRISVLAPYSEQAQVFTIEGHRWPVEPLMPGSNLVDATGVGGLEAFTVLPVGGAGGPRHLPGTYGFGNHREPYREAGAWGTLVVHDPCGPAVEGVERLPDRTRTCGGGGWMSSTGAGAGLGIAVLAAAGLSVPRWHRRRVRRQRVRRLSSL